MLMGWKAAIGLAFSGAHAGALWGGCGSSHVTFTNVTACPGDACGVMSPETVATWVLKTQGRCEAALRGHLAPFLLLL